MDPGPGAATLAGLVRRPVETCSPRTPTRHALETMRRLRIGAMVIVDAGRHPVGILTLRDVVDRIVLAPGALDAPIEVVMTPAPVGLPLDASAYEAARLMVRRGVRHVLVLDARACAVGIVSERDLFGMQTAGVRHLSLAIRSADDLAECETYGREIQALARTLVQQGAATGPLTAFISSLIDLLTERIVRIELERTDLAADVCWIVLGSEGRSEQTLSTDQDNGFVFRASTGASDDAMRERLLPVARRINEALDRAGYRLCSGNIMASNPDWCASADEWRRKFSRWIDSGSPEALLHGAIFFDLRGLTGALELAEELRAWLVAHAARNPRFLHQMAGNALRSRPALTRWTHALAPDAQGRIDLKMHGATPFIDAARILSLASAEDEVRTELRLRRASQRLGIPAGETEAWVAGFYLVQGYRLRHQLRCIDAGVAPDNLLPLADLNRLDRQLLRAGLDQGRLLQRRLALDYGL
jgi:CBS domain-containing protein